MQRAMTPPSADYRQSASTAGDLSPSSTDSSVFARLLVLDRQTSADLNLEA